MTLNELRLESFRNYGDCSFTFDPGGNLILGDNAQGKPNLLEAIAFLGSGKSFRAQKTAELIRFGSDCAQLEGKVHSQEREQSLRWVLFSGSRPRQLWRNGVKKKTAADIGGERFLSRYSILHSCKGGMNAMKKTELKELYQMMFPNYPDIVTVKQLQVMLGVSRHLAYKLINDGEIQAVKIGTSLKIPKVSVINFVTEERREVKPGA